MKSVRKGTKATAASLTAIKVGATALVGGLILLGREYEKLNKSINRSLAIMGNVSDAMRKDMTAAAIEVAKTTNASASEAAEGFFFLASAGLDAEQSLAALPKVAKFAQAGNFDLALATDLLTDAQSALGLTVKDTMKNMDNMSRVSDVLVKANTLANATVQQFSESLTNKAGAALRIVGKDIEEGAAVLAVFADQGVKGAEAGTALNIVMRDLQTKSIKFSGDFKKAGIAVFDAGGEMRNVADIVSDLEGRLTGLSDVQKKSTLLDLGFADKSVAFIQALVGTSEKIRDYEKALRGAGGATGEVADKQLTNLEKATNRLGAAFAQAAQNMAPLVDKAANLLDTVSALAALNFNDGKRLDGGKFGESTGKSSKFQQFNTPQSIAKFDSERPQRQMAALVDGFKSLPTVFQGIKNAVGAAGEKRKAQQDFVQGAFDAVGTGIGSTLDGLQAGFGRLVVGKLSLQRNLAIAQGKQMNSGNKVASVKTKQDTRGPLAALQAGTAEAFAASRKNINPAAKTDLKIQEAQLAIQKRMADGIEGLASNGMAEFGIV
ncbi:phage tail tape measure protein [bacterium]|nr:MAG: phage tail tape measure protein [bacterium]